MQEYLPELQLEFFTYCFFAMCLASLIQILYLIFIFSRLSFYRKKETVESPLMPISVIIAARNESDNLYENLPAILNQDYPEFEVIVVNHQSIDDSNWLLIAFQQQYKNLKVIDIQPGEFTKLFLILWASLLLARKERAQKMRINAITLIAPGFMIVIAFIMRGGDLGTTSVIAAILAGLLFVSGVDLKKMGLVTAIFSLALAVGIATSDYRRARFLVFLNPFAPEDYKSFGWQPAHSLLGLASGGVFGVGLGGSRQKWGNLPEAHTDFIFSVIGEELGLIGTCAVLVLIGTLIYSIFRIAHKAKDPFSRYATAGIACWIGIQAILNIGTAISVLPVVGVTLPLVSYGGSALLTTIFALGFVIGVSLRDKEVSKELVRRFKDK